MPARQKLTLFLIAIMAIFLFSLEKVSAVSPGDVVINEIMYDLEGSDANHEWIEVKNIGTKSADLTDWRFEEGGTKHTLTLRQGDIKIPINGYAVIADNTDQFLTDYSGFSGTLIDSSFSFSNTGERLALLKSKDGPIIDEVTYLSEWGASGDGRTLQRKDGDFAEGPIGGTPGKENEFPSIPTPMPTPSSIPTSELTPTPSPQPEASLLEETPSPKPVEITGATLLGKILGEEESSPAGFYPWEATEEAKSQEATRAPKAKFISKLFLGLGLVFLFVSGVYLWYNLTKGRIIQG